MLGLGFAPQLDRLADLLLRRAHPVTTSAAAAAAPPPEAAVASAPPEALPKKKRRREADRTLLVPAADPAVPAPGDGSAGGESQRPQVLLLSATGAAEGPADGPGSGDAQVPEAMQRWVLPDAAHACVGALTGASISETTTQVRLPHCRTAALLRC